jgi:predicted Na+-dependent transporter
MSLLIAASRLIANQLAPITLLGAVVAYLHPPLFLVFKSSFLWFFAATMFAMGIVLDVGELRETLRKPARIGLGVMTQFTVMPLLGFMAALLAPLPEAKPSSWGLLSWPVRPAPWPATSWFTWPVVQWRFPWR